MLSQNQMVRASLEALYRDMAVFFVESVMEDENGVLKSVEEQSEPFPCRLSYESRQVVAVDGVPEMVEDVHLFFAPEIEIPAGAKVDVSHFGRALRFKSASRTASYGTHAEIALAERNRYGDGENG